MTNLLLVDRGVRLYQALLTELHNDAEIGAIHACESAEEALERRLEGAYGAVLINASSLPQREALKLTREVARRYPDMRVLVFGLAAAKERVLEFIEAGAKAYVRESESVQAIGRALREMLHGEARLCPDVAAAILSRIARLAGYRGGGSTNNRAVARLSRRQREVLDLLQHGMSNAEIADRLSIEVGTVKNHVHNLLTKLQVTDRHAAARLASGVVDSDELPVH